MSNWRRIITVEPLIGIYALATYCRTIMEWRFKWYFKDESGWSSDHTIVQMMRSTIPIILVLFFGAYSDKFNKRKPFLLFPIFGEIISLVGYAICMVLTDQCPYSLNTVLQCVPSFYGGKNLLYMAALALIADVSGPSTISFRIGILYVIEHMAELIYFPVIENYFRVYVIGEDYTMSHWLLLSGTGAVLLVALFYGIFWVKEPKPSDTQNSTLIKNLFHPKHPLETSSLLVRQYSGRERVYVFILLHLISTYALVNFDGHYGLFESIDALTKRHVLFFLLCSSLGTLVIIPLFTRSLTLDDTKVLIISCVSQILSLILIGLATNAAILYLASMIGIFPVLMVVISISMAFKLTSPDDFGKIAAVVMIFDSSGYSFASMIKGFFNDSFKFVYFGAILFAILLLLVVWMHIDNRKKKTQEPPRNNSNVDNEEYEEHQL